MTPHLKYLRTVLRHKWFVFMECAAYGLWWQGITHDWSKFLPSEWFPYVAYFNGGYPTPKPVAVQAAFDSAWNHHQKIQPHHYQYWVLIRDDGSVEPLPMPDKYRKEMIADWRGAGKAYGNANTRQWYLDHKEQIYLHPDTRVWVERELKV